MSVNDQPGRMNSEFLTRFPGKLAHWALHGTLNALPSFIIAAVYLRLWDKPQAVLAMISAVAVFIVTFATLTSLPGPQSDDSHVIARSIRLGARIRSWIASFSLPLLAFHQAAVFFVPDFWCGWLAVAVHQAAMKQLGAPRGANGIDDPTFGSIFSITLLEGIILSFLLLMIAFFCLVFQQARERRRAMRAFAAG